jgi:signal transduction histidine kinase
MISHIFHNINHLYQSLLSAIESLEIEKRRVSESEKSKADFLRAASHELKTPVTALNATLENMILGVGKYKDYDTYLPECREMTGHLADMIHDILETSKVGMAAENEDAAEVDLPGLLSSLCEPFYRPDFARDRDKGGNGLGLYIVDTLLKTMDISYSFCPMEEPQGMRFTIHL